jgi:hypothetical protein
MEVEFKPQVLRYLAYYSFLTIYVLAYGNSANQLIRSISSNVHRLSTSRLSADRRKTRIHLRPHSCEYISATASSYRDSDQAYMQHNGRKKTPSPNPPGATPLPLRRDGIRSRHVVLRE